MIMLAVIAVIMPVYVVARVWSLVKKNDAFLNVLTANGDIALQCHSCGRTLNIPVQYAGQEGTCNHCHSPIVVPSLPPEARPPVPITTRQWTAWMTGIVIMLGLVLMESQVRYHELTAPVTALDSQGMVQQVAPGMPESEALSKAITWIFVPQTFTELCLCVILWSTVALIALSVKSRRSVGRLAKPEAKKDAAKVPPTSAQRIRRRYLQSVSICGLGLLGLTGLMFAVGLLSPKEPPSRSTEESTAKRGDAAPSDATASSDVEEVIRAVEEVIRAAEQGDADAQYTQGCRCKYGCLGVPQDDVEAFTWFKKAAEQGHAKAQCSLAFIYCLGRGVPKDEYESVKWFRLAAEQGDAHAQHGLGRAYSLGLGVPKDESESVKWYRLAAQQGHVRAQFLVGCAYENGNGVERDPREAVKWFKEAAEQGSAVAQTELGCMYWNGEGVPKDVAESLKLWRRAANQGQAMAQLKLGLFYSEGDVVPRDFAEAYMWLNLARVADKDANKIPLDSGANEAAKTFLDYLEGKMSPEQIAAAQERSARFVAREEAAGQSSIGSIPDDLDSASSPPIKTGTAFCIAPDGIFITAAHVIEGSRSLMVRALGKELPARVLTIDNANDIAVLTVKGSFHALPIRASKDVKAGESVFTVGFPNTEMQGLSPKVTKGEISSLSGIRDDPRFFQTSVQIQPGNSGGALLDTSGNVVGLVTMQLDSITALERTGVLPQSVNYALKSTYLLSLLESIQAANGYLPKTNGRKDFEEAVEAAMESTALVLAY